MVRYLVKEIFGPTLQGEGFHTGRACVFLRFANCNLQCTWCDTDFSPHTARRMTADEVVEALHTRDTSASRLVIVTGGEPTLQYDEAMAHALHQGGFEVHMESNGTHPLSGAVDWLVVSPKPQFHKRQSLLGPWELPIDELKVVVDGSVTLDTLAGYEAMYPSAIYTLQPCDTADGQTHTQRAVDFAIARPRWRFSTQLHKTLGMP